MQELQIAEIAHLSNGAEPVTAPNRSAAYSALGEVGPKRIRFREWGDVRAIEPSQTGNNSGLFTPRTRPASKFEIEFREGDQVLDITTDEQGIVASRNLSVRRRISSLSVSGNKLVPVNPLPRPSMHLHFSALTCPLCLLYT